MGERFGFESGGATLAGVLEPAVGPVRGAALLAHCFTCSKDFVASKTIAQALARRGFATLRFDFTGLGGSEGEFANTDFSSNVDDLVAASRALAERVAPPTLLVGHSLGGAAVIAAAPRIEGVRAVATIAAPAEPEHVLHNFESAVEEIEREGEATVTLAGRPFTIRKGFVEDVREQALNAALKGLRAALMVLHAPRDETVGIDSATRLFAAAKHPKSFVSLDDADHLLTRKADADYAASVIAAWASRYVDAPEVAPTEKGVRAIEADPDGYLTRIDLPRGRTMAADEPREVGGTDEGPTPFELVGAGLAACTTMTMRMYARRKGWEPGAAAAHVAWRQEDRHTTTFTRTLTLDPALEPEQHERLVEIADRCPVHRMLEGSVEIVTEVTDGPPRTG